MLEPALDPGQLQRLVRRQFCYLRSGAACSIPEDALGPSSTLREACLRENGETLKLAGTLRIRFKSNFRAETDSVELPVVVFATEVLDSFQEVRER